MAQLAVSAPVLRLELTVDLAESRRAATATREYLTAQGWDDPTVVDCVLALVEACNNAIRYCPPTERKRPIIVEVECRTVDIEMRVLDHSAGFDWPKRVTLPGPESESGRGIYIIQTVMDRVDYRQGDEGNTLVMCRSRRS